MDSTKYLQEEKLLEDIELENEIMFSDKPELNYTNLISKNKLRCEKKKDDDFFKYTFDKIKDKKEKLKRTLKLINQNY